MLPFGMLRADRQGLYQDVLKKHWPDFLKKSVVAWLNFQMPSPISCKWCSQADTTALFMHQGDWQSIRYLLVLTRSQLKDYCLRLFIWRRALKDLVNTVDSRNVFQRCCCKYADHGDMAASVAKMTMDTYFCYQSSLWFFQLPVEGRQYYSHDSPNSGCTQFLTQGDVGACDLGSLVVSPCWISQMQGALLWCTIALQGSESS